MSDENQTADILSSVEGGQELLDLLEPFRVYERPHPNFGDAEVVSLMLRRQGPSELIIRLDLPGQSAVVTFSLHDWIDLRVSGFSHQNVIGGLFIRRAGQREIASWEKGVGCTPGDHEIELEPCFGAYGVIRATLAKVRVQRL